MGCQDVSVVVAEGSVIAIRGWTAPVAVAALVATVE
jgi:hypothetical protein